MTSQGECSNGIVKTGSRSVIQDSGCGKQSVIYCRIDVFFQPIKLQQSIKNGGFDTFG